MYKDVLKTILALATVFCITLSTVYAAQEPAENVKEYETGYLNSVIEMIKEKYKGEVTDKMLIEGALKGMFGTMDAYTTYFSVEEAEGFIGGIEGAYEGIGISFTRENQDVEVNEVFKASPAEEAGIQKGDIIVDVEGQIVKDKTDDQIAALIKGKEGTKVTLGILRKGQTEVIKLEVLRKRIE
ncbi:MAG: PDZ domain-containing protein, partial [Clostridiaceae bacterium]|nr:PDZ domain-containing protein [Clostridiaceae bacterium]